MPVMDAETEAVCFDALHSYLAMRLEQQHGVPPSEDAMIEEIGDAMDEVADGMLEGRVQELCVRLYVKAKGFLDTDRNAAKSFSCFAGYAAAIGKYDKADDFYAWMMRAAQSGDTIKANAYEVLAALDDFVGDPAN